MSDKITVLGSGVMGHGIAQLAAQSGFEVALYDLQAELLEKALDQVRKNLDKGVEKGKISAPERDEALKRLQISADLDAALNDSALVIEAVPEKLTLKMELFSKISRKVSDEAILATNTSSLSISKIASAAHKPDRILGMHFFNPPYIMKLLELVHAPRTAPEVLEKARGYAQKMQREIIVVRDSPGFATSRLGVVLGLEAMRMLEQNVASADDIDRAMELGYKHPMGPLRLTDLVGLDTRLNIAEYLHKELGGEQYKPPLILRTLVSEGKLGQKSGQGFYRWDTTPRSTNATS